MSNYEKNILLVVGFFIFLALAYFFAIQKTFDLKSQAKKLTQDKELLDNASERIFLLQQENRYLDSIFNAKEISIENSFQQTLLKKINNFQQNNALEIIAFNEPHSIIQDNTSIKTYDFKVKGRFKELLSLLQHLEHQQLGMLVSVNFEKKRDYRRNTYDLIGHFFIQEQKQEQ